MALSDYYLCDLCDSKTFYDGNLNYDDGNENTITRHPWPNGDVGWMAVLCKECSKTNKIIIVKYEDLERMSVEEGNAK